MIDTTYLNGYQKEFAREVGQLRFLLTLINELKMNFQQIKNISESESKSFDSLQKNISNQVKIFLTDSSTVNDDPTLFLKFSNMFISILDNYGRCFSDEVSIINSTVYKMNHQISEEYSILTKGIVENSNFVLKDLLNSRAKYRSSVNKTEKVVKELETAFSSKRKLDNEHSYNMTLRDKVEDRILNLLNDFEEYKGIINNNFDEVKKFENFLNEFLKNQFSKILKFSFVNHKRLHSNYETIVGIKIALFNKIKIILDSGVESIKYIEIDYSSNEYEKKYCDLKSVKFDDIHTVSLDENFNKMNFNSIMECLTNYMNSFLSCANIRKKILWFLFKFLSEISRFAEGLVISLNKLLKSPFISPKTSACNSSSITDVFDFFRSLFELEIKKSDEWLKLINGNSVILIDCMIKELYNEENSIINFWNKIQKETNVFKEKSVKLNSQKEKTLSNIISLKEDIQKTSDDPNNFPKFENKLHNLRIEESHINDQITDNNRKFKKYLEENIESLKSLTKSFKVNETKKFLEIKESFLNLIQVIEKVSSQISEFLLNRNHINNDPKDDIKTIFGKYSKDFSVDNNCVSYFFDLHLKDCSPDNSIAGNENNYLLNEESVNNSNKPGMQEILENICFLDKDEMVVFKDFKTEFLKEEEIENYRDKLRYLKQNLKKITIKNLLIPSTRQKYEDIFFIDCGEKVLDDFSCALSDKILLQGQIFLTNKKIVFYSWFNNSTLFGKTILEIPLSDIVLIDKKYNLIFDNSIFIKTNSTELFLTSFIQRDKCFKRIENLLIKQGILKEKSTSKSNSENTSVNQDHINQENMVFDPLNIEEKNSLNLGLNNNEVKDEIPALTKEINILSLINEYGFLEKLREQHKLRIETLETSDNPKMKLAKNFNINILKEETIGDIPLPLLFRAIYSPNFEVNELEKGKNFLRTIMEIRKDYNVNFIDSNFDEAPQFYNDNEFLIQFSTQINKDIMEKTIENIKNWPLLTEYEYKYTHPVKKVFMGPEKLEVNEKYKFYHISPLSFIVEVYVYLSGFMLMDTFYTYFQYKFDTEMDFNENENRFVYNTKITANLGIEFVKPNFMKTKIESENLKENELFIRECLFPNISKVASIQGKQFLERCMNINLKNDLKPKGNEDLCEKQEMLLTRENNFCIIQSTDKNIYTLLEQALKRCEVLEKRIVELESSKKD